MPHIEIRSSTAADVYALAANLRLEDAREVGEAGLDLRQAIRRSYRNAILRKSYFVDGELAAMTGLCGAMLADIGEPYLMTAPACERVKVSFVKHARAAVNEMLKHRLQLVGEVHASYTRACRLLEVLGFSLSDPHPLGPKGALFRRYSIMRPSSLSEVKASRMAEMEPS